MLKVTQLKRFFLLSVFLMIKLILHPDTQAVTYIFEKNCVFIGTNAHPKNDLLLPGEILQPLHIRIVEENNRFIITNEANDPFCTLNGKPFGKKAIKTGDLIRIGTTPLRFEGEPMGTVFHDTTTAIPEILSHAMAEKVQEIQKLPSAPPLVTEEAQWMKSQADAGLNVEEEIGKIQGQYEETEDENLGKRPNDTWFKPNAQELDVDAIADELDIQAEAKEKQPAPYQEKLFIKEQNLMNEPIPTPSTFQIPFEPAKQLKKKGEEYYLTEFDEENESWNYEREEKIEHTTMGSQVSHKKINWKTVLCIITAILLLIALIGSSLYVRISDKSIAEEIKAAEGVSDLAMALTYAKVHHIKPQKQNWSDPDFLKNNLAAILTSDYPSLAYLDSHCHFTNCNYILRIYTNSDFNHFIVIAQPAPSLKQWLIPKSAILVDSAMMELRKLDNLKALNRMLVDPKILDGKSSEEVTKLIQEGELIPLTALANKKKDKGFSPPKALALIRPGAQNAIYNAPRYYQLGDEIMKRALGLLNSSGSTHEMERLKQELDVLEKMQDIVLYSNRGIQMAMEAQRALGTFFPEHKFLTAYFQFNNRGEIINSHLLMDEEYDPVADKSSSEWPRSKTHESTSYQERKLQVASANVLPEPDNELDPLVYQLKSLSHGRQAALKPVGEEIMVLLKHNQEGFVINFSERFHNLLKEYERVNLEQQDLITKNLMALYNEFKRMPIKECIPYLKMCGLESFMAEILHAQAKRLGSEIPSSEEIAQAMQKIRMASNFEELDLHTTAAANLLNVDRLPDFDRLAAYQNQFRSLVLQKLNSFLFSPEYPVQALSIEQTDRSVLEHILHSVWVKEPHEYDYYLSEFDLLNKR